MGETTGIDWKASSEAWRAAYLRWQAWAAELLARAGAQPEGGLLGDDPAREAIARMVQGVRG